VGGHQYPPGSNYHLDEVTRSILTYVNYTSDEFGETMTMEPSGEDIPRVQSLFQQVHVIETSHEQHY
jgi:hypothetical protein